MGEAPHRIADLEAALQPIFEKSPDRAFAKAELMEQLAAARTEPVNAEDLRKALWNLYYRRVAEPVAIENQPQRWQLARKQTDMVKNRQPMWSGNLTLLK